MGDCGRIVVRVFMKDFNEGDGNMGLFDFLKKKDQQEQTVKNSNETEVSVPEAEKKYYQPDEYYTKKSHEGTMFEKTVITFEERKKTCIPSNRGLYVAEILLLEYCSYGKYPGPKNGYPGFWWFTYGIRDVGAALKDLEMRGYIELNQVKDAVNSLTIPQLKELLARNGQAVTGKKTELVKRVVDVVSDAELLDAGVVPKYALTELGKQELRDNEYVAYMHKYPYKTIEESQFGKEFNVWSINRLLGSGDKSNWKEIVDQQEEMMNTETKDRNDAFMKDLKTIDPNGYKALKSQDKQIAAVQKAQAQYKDNKDLDAYIHFWEQVWANGGLLFEGAGWYFELPDLYIKAKRYDDALAFVKKIKATKTIYGYKADKYIERIDGLKAKQATKKK